MPSVQEARPGQCPHCEVASRPVGGPLNLHGHGVRDRQLRGPLDPQLLSLSLRRYLDKRLPLMNYKALIEQDLELATGAGEGAIKNIIGARFDIGGSRWISVPAASGEWVLHLQKGKLSEVRVVRVDRPDLVLKQQGCQVRVWYQVASHDKAARHLLVRLPESCFF